MKRIIFALLPCLLFGCSNFFRHDAEISNKSGSDVSFSMRGYGDTVYSLASGKSIEVECYNNPELIFTGHPRVKYTSGENVVISDLTGYGCTIANSAPEAVVVKEERFRLGGESDDSGIEIGRGEEKETTLYTESPRLVAVSKANEELRYNVSVKSYVAKVGNENKTKFKVTVTP